MTYLDLPHRSPEDREVLRCSQVYAATQQNVHKKTQMDFCPGLKEAFQAVVSLGLAKQKNPSGITRQVPPLAMGAAKAIT
ncbi:hypothetical protein [Paenibacillus illinoisensis]|uniref:Uncharacterized protein n=1 Tax=Paenibacillus illinoisensis TaxID=59845 RepID=A0A2W0CXP0_9BACL|nr:hypothetical protein [Paenibacillus illinoisensis]PYY28421.1 hypothetical protein PIL02S_03582 [Paenibacillus illinoisensis]